MQNGWMPLAGELEQEMQSVYDHLTQMADELESPLRDLVHSQVGAAQPYLHAAVVLAAGFDIPDSPQLQKGRIFLATALEMLFIALSIHNLLMSHDDALDEDRNKTVLGSTVLAGDYCFSQSAIMAARTENPEVVAIFANALQDVSEGQLRQIFNLNNLPTQTNAVLFQAGVRAAAKLHQASADTERQLVELSSHFASYVQRQQELVDLDNTDLDSTDLDNAELGNMVDKISLPTPLKNRWNQVIQLV